MGWGARRERGGCGVWRLRIIVSSEIRVSGSVVSVLGISIRIQVPGLGFKGSGFMGQVQVLGSKIVESYPFFILLCFVIRMQGGKGCGV